MFAKAMASEFKNQGKLLEEIRDLVQKQNGQIRDNEIAIAGKPDEKRVRDNEIAVAGLRTWVAVVGGVGGIGGLIAVILAWVMN